jgi:hypothetical protein
VQCGIPQRDAVRARALAQRVDRAVADAARWRVDGTLERRIVVAIGDQAQVGQRILDFGAVEKAQPAVDAIADVVLDQLFFEVARLRVRAVQHGAFAGPAAVLNVLADAVDDEARLVLFVVGGIQCDRFAGPAGCPQMLAEALRIVGDDRVRGLENRRSRPVVLLETDGLGARKVAQEMLHVLDTCTAPAVDRLVVVADDKDLSGLPGQHANPRVLQRVGVLELVDQQVPIAVAVVVEQCFVVQP